MATFERVYFIKAGLFIGIILLLLNIYNYSYGIIPMLKTLAPVSDWTTRNSNAHWSNGTNVHIAHAKVILERRISNFLQLNSSNSNKSDNSAMGLKASSKNLEYCPPIPPNLVGPIKVNKTIEDITIIESQFVRKLSRGGWYQPKECVARHRIAIIIPYRDRPQHLPVFLANIHPFLMKQQLEYGIFLIEQVAKGKFNRAALLNVGYVESQKLGDWDCFIFHDIDLLPMDDRNVYNCYEQPRHMSVAVDTMGFKLPYDGIFGGVVALTKKQFRKLNGFSNCFWGWGGEDDDMSARIRLVGYEIARSPINIARYTMLHHISEVANPDRFHILHNGAWKYENVGLNSLDYEVQYIEKKILYTWVLVEINRDKGCRYF